MSLLLPLPVSLPLSLSLCAYHKKKDAREKKKQIDPTPNRRIELIKIRAELKEINTRRNVE